jgi:RimJ/RimL family protein N-acetyltransferase
MRKSMKLRRATPDDALALAKAHVDSWHGAYRGLVPDSFLGGFTVERRTKRFRESIAAGAEETYVVEEDGEVLGFLTLGKCRDSDVDDNTTGEIWGIYLAPKHWRKGIGTLMTILQVKSGESILPRSTGVKE